MKKFLLLLLLTALLGACGTHRHNMEFAAGKTAIPTTAKYRVEPAVDDTGFTFDDKEESIDIGKAMTDALILKLREENLYAETPAGSFAVKSTVTGYEPGNAFGRWLMPGVGSTKVEVSSAVLDPEQQTIGSIKTRNTVDAGGAFTVGAWKTVFEDAAEEVVKELKESMGLVTESK
jgi:hypothetical protein